MNQESLPTILCVDDEHAILSSLRRVFRREGYSIITASSGTEALTIMEKNEIDLLISDMRMPHMSGDQLLIEVARRWPETQRILLTGYSELDSATKAEDDGDIYCRVDKPWNEKNLLETVSQAIAVKKKSSESVKHAK